MSSIARDQTFSKQFIPAFRTLQLAIAGTVFGGLMFSRLETASLLVSLSLVAGTAAFLSHDNRDLLIRISLLLISLASLRACASFLDAKNLGMIGFACIWLILMLIVVAALNLCLLPLGLGVVSALRAFLPTITSKDYLRDKRLWYLNWLVFMPLVMLSAPWGISFAAWAVQGQGQLAPTLGMHAVSGIALGASLPLGALASFVFSLSEDGNRSGNSWTLKIGRHSIGWTGLVLGAVGIYLLGVWLEHGGPQMYGLWTVCWIILFVAVVTLGRLTNFVGSRSDPTPDQFREESEGRKSRPKSAFVFVWLYFFTFAYFEILASIFGR